MGDKLKDADVSMPASGEVHQQPNNAIMSLLPCDVLEAKQNIEHPVILCPNAFSEETVT